MKTAIFIFAMFGTLGAMLDLFKVPAIVQKITAHLQWVDLVLALPMLVVLTFKMI